MDGNLLTRGLEAFIWGKLGSVGKSPIGESRQEIWKISYNVGCGNPVWLLKVAEFSYGHLEVCLKSLGI